MNFEHLKLQRCYNHAGREAAARCLHCDHFFCRECVTEHDDQVICAVCLAAAAARLASRRRRSRTILRCLCSGLSGILLAWLFFYGIGKALLLLPHSFHEGTVWEEAWQFK